MSDYTNRRTPRLTRFTFVGHRFDPRRTRATFYYRDNLDHHYAEKIDFDGLEDARVDRKLLARALDFALFALGCDYFAAHPTDLVASKKPVSTRLAALLTTANSVLQFTTSDPRPGLPYQGSGNLVLMDPVDASLNLATELTVTHLPFRPLYIAASPACQTVPTQLGKPLTLIYRPQPLAGAHRSQPAVDAHPQPLTDIALALIQTILYNFNRLYLSYPADTQLTDFIHHEISPDLELIWKN